MDASELLAREAIRDTLARYAHDADTGRFEALAELFADDGVMVVPDRDPLTGRAAILEFLGRARRRLSDSSVQAYIRHHVTSVRIDIESADSARAASYFLALTARGPDHWGRYRDRLVRRGERWLFQERQVLVDGRAPDGWAARRSL
jgi:uncharacterized protein (TIGR02246 family)